MSQAYCAAIQRAVQAVKAEAGQAHVLDMGCGTGLLSLAAARAGAASVLACDLHQPLCEIARRVRFCSFCASSLLSQHIQHCWRVAVRPMHRLHSTLPMRMTSLRLTPSLLIGCLHRQQRGMA